MQEFTAFEISDLRFVRWNYIVPFPVFSKFLFQCGCILITDFSGNLSTRATVKKARGDLS
jgi:hypothetical protein